MRSMDIDALSALCAAFTAGRRFTRAEHEEILRIALGCACKEAAVVSGLATETIRSRRKRIYRKLRMPGACELLSSLLAFSMTGERRDRATAAPEPRASGVRADEAGAGSPP